MASSTEYMGIIVKTDMISDCSSQNTVRDKADWQGHSQDFSLGGHRSSAEGARIEAQNFWNFYIKMVSFRAFWIAISYRLAACFTRIGIGIEILPV